MHKHIINRKNLTVPENLNMSGDDQIVTSLYAIPTPYLT